MSKTGQNLFKTIATRGIIAVIPVAMASAYASNMMVPTPPRLAEYAYQQVAEITVSPDTVGVAESPLYGQTKQQIDAQLDQLQALGVQSIRVFVPWGLVDYFGPSNPGSASWAQLDLVMQAAKERNMGVLAEFDSTPPYAVTTGNAGSGTPDPAAFATFVTKFVQQYGDVVSAYEIWNEQNGVLSSNPIDPASYAALLKAAYNAIKPLDPTATVVMGGLGHVITVNGISMDPVDFLNAMIAADPTIGNYFDALAYHPYDETTSFSGGNLNPAVVGSWASDTAYNQVKDLMALFPTKKVWITEFGVPTYSYTYTDFWGNTQTVSVTQAQQEALIQNFLQNWSSLGGQAGPVFLYTGQDTNTGDGVANDNYGLYDDQGNPKSVVAWLTQWFIDHPQIPSTPTTPTSPGAAANPLAAIIQSIVQSFTNAIVQFQAVFANFAKAIANAISALFGQPVAPAAQVTATAAPLAMKLAATVASNTSSAADTGTPSAAKVVEADAAAEAPAASAAEAAPTAAEAAPAAVEAAAAPAATPTPAAAAEPAPAAAAPAMEAAAAPAAEPTSTPASPTPASPTSASSTAGTSSTGTSGGCDKGATDSSSSKDSGTADSSSADSSSATKTSKPDKHDSSDKTGSSDKTASSDKTGSSDSSASDSTSSRHAKDKGGNDFSPRHVKPSGTSDGAGAGKVGADSSSSSGSSSSGSQGGGAEG